MIFDLLQRWVLRIGGLALAFIGCTWLWVHGPGAAVALATGLVLAVGVVAWHLYWPIVLLWSRK